MSSLAAEANLVAMASPVAVTDLAATAAVAVESRAASVAAHAARPVPAEALTPVVSEETMAEAAATAAAVTARLTEQFLPSARTSSSQRVRAFFLDCVVARLANWPTVE